MRLWFTPWKCVCLPGTQLLGSPSCRGKDLWLAIGWRTTEIILGAKWYQPWDRGMNPTRQPKQNTQSTQQLCSRRQRLGCFGGKMAHPCPHGSTNSIPISQQWDCRELSLPVTVQCAWPECPHRCSLEETRYPQGPLDEELKQAFWIISEVPPVSSVLQTTETHLLTLAALLASPVGRLLTSWRNLHKGLRSPATKVLLLKLYRKKKSWMEGLLFQIDQRKC